MDPKCDNHSCGFSVDSLIKNSHPLSWNYKSSPSETCQFGVCKYMDVWTRWCRVRIPDERHLRKIVRDRAEKFLSRIQMLPTT